MYTQDMKKKVIDLVVTESILESRLDERFEKFEDRIATRIVTEITFQLDKAKREIDDSARGYRDDVLTKMDGVVGELEDSRIEHKALKNDIGNLEGRLAKLEHTAKAI